MTTFCPLTLPARTPTSWQLKLPDYPVIANNWRSGSFPELLGSVPNGAEWQLFFENQSSSEALETLRLWDATANGRWPLGRLPQELAGGIDDDDFWILLIGTTWSMAQEPRLEPIKNRRFNVTIDLVYELTDESHYGPINPMPPDFAYLATVGGVPIVTIDGRHIVTGRCFTATCLIALDGKFIVASEGKRIAV